jgi:hypothetical protein
MQGGCPDHPPPIIPAAVRVLRMKAPLPPKRGFLFPALTKPSRGPNRRPHAPFVCCRHGCRCGFAECSREFRSTPKADIRLRFNIGRDGPISTDYPICALRKLLGAAGTEPLSRQAHVCCSSGRRFAELPDNYERHALTRSRRCDLLLRSHRQN